MTAMMLLLALMALALAGPPTPSAVVTCNDTIKIARSTDIPFPRTTFDEENDVLITIDTSNYDYYLCSLSFTSLG